LSDTAARKRLTEFFTVSADGATAPETLRHQDCAAGTIWREAPNGVHRRGHPRQLRGLSSQVPRQMGPIESAFADWDHVCSRGPQMAHIAVVGAGITGITTAYALLDCGHQVTVFERHRYPAMETSFANGGQLSASNAEVWNHPANLAKVVGWLFRDDAPLLLNLRPSWHKYSWLAEFAAHLPRYRNNTIATVRLALEARRELLAIAEREAINFDFERRGILHIYRDRRGFEHANRVNALLRSGGLERHAVTADEIKNIEPTIHGEFYGGFFTESDSTGDIHKFTCQLAVVCERRGARVVCDATVEDIATESGITVKWRGSRPDEGARVLEETEADAVVICAGVASRRLAAALGDRVNVYPVKGYSVTVELNDEISIAAAPWVSLLDDDTKIVSSRLGRDRFRVAGTAEFNGFNRDIRDVRIDPLVAWIRQLFPLVSTERVVPWSGLRPMMPSMLPRVGAGRQAGVFYNTGHGHLGWTLSTATARITADIVQASLGDLPVCC
jgi:D-amino-acid dehydrogenase